MLKIINQQGLILELDPTKVITVEKNNPLFNDADKLFQDKSYSCTAGFTEPNKLFFNLGHLVESPNSYYTFPVQVFAAGDLFLTGNLTFRIAPDGYEFNLEPNLVALNSLLRNIRLTDIRALDKAYTSMTFSEMEALMLDTCQNPDNHPFIFFPVCNMQFDPVNLTAFPFQFVNHYDADAQAFKAHLFRTVGGSVYDEAGYQSPYYKLTYILQVVAEYLGFTATGSLFTDPDFKNKCIYTQQAVSTGPDNFNPSNFYLPAMLITDFFKQIRERHHIAIDFDLTTGELTFESFRSIVNSEPVDITQYIGNIIEQELPETTGSSVTLKSDQQDVQFKITVNGTDTYPALYQLIAGDGKNVVELDCGTTKGIDLTTGTVRGDRYPIVNQPVYYGSVSTDGNNLNYTDVTEANKWPLRLIQYLGYNEIQPGRFYPEAGPDNFGADDVQYFQFKNDSKRLIIDAYFPPAVLAGLKATSKCVFKTAGYNFCNIIIEHTNYDLGLNIDLIPAKIYARTLNFDIKTHVSIIPINNVDDSQYLATNGYLYLKGVVKAYFDPLIHGFSQLNFTLIPHSGDNVYKCKPVLMPTNYKGAGGVVAGMYYISGNYTGNVPERLCITQGHPKYMIYRGQRTDFTYNSAAGYYYVDLPELESFSYAFDCYTVFF